ncbi:hypothetical protein NBRC111894_1660 [Sporolactobacillus inulinus]|uniref:Uncharacterized protein n=1 Tax=Sporolactobacillus inulinus TaxID=2078 RepID=A0A4Y1ZAL8_9BACL|nr:hypothetical protein NBRC111894_1660 [Sporolactobacillus inulinus]
MLEHHGTLPANAALTRIVYRKTAIFLESKKNSRCNVRYYYSYLSE